MLDLVQGELGTREPARYTRRAGRNSVLTGHRSPSIRRGAATDRHFPGALGAPRKYLPLPTVWGLKPCEKQGKRTDVLDLFLAGEIKGVMWK